MRLRSSSGPIRRMYNARSSARRMFLLLHTLLTPANAAVSKPRPPSIVRNAPKCCSGSIQYRGISTSLQVPMRPRFARSSSAPLNFLS
eukprot:9462912-Lingulodinium_polyedra.AAC.1